MGPRRFPTRRTGAETADGVGGVVGPADDGGVGVVVVAGSTPGRVGHVPEWIVQFGAFLWQIATPFASLWLDRLLGIPPYGRGKWQWLCKAKYRKEYRFPG